jgi:peptidoglycan-N-acetylglucosamine deacetylase
MYFIKTPYLLKKAFPKRVWHIATNDKVLYLTFDDGPHPTITPFVLEQLKQYNAKATFFCIGKNVELYPEVFEQIESEHHSIGNHTQHHLNGFKTDDDEYIRNINEARKCINSNLFRPPYGRCTSFQAKIISQQLNMNIIMWDVLSGDFDTSITPKSCTENVLLNATKGSIIVFHDSEKAFERLKEALPKTLEYFSKKGYTFKAL